MDAPCAGTRAGFDLPRRSYRGRKGKEVTATDEERSGEVRLGHSSEEAGEQRFCGIGGAGGAKARPKGNPEGQSTRRAQDRGSVTQAADRIRQAARRNPGERLVALLHHINVDTLRDAYFGLKKGAATGVDGVTWDEYGHGLEDRLRGLQDRVHPVSPRSRTDLTCSSGTDRGI